MKVIMKRKHENEDSDSLSQPLKKPHLSSASLTRSRFSPELFNPETLTKHQAEYQTSQPYRHGVISNFISDGLLRSVRTEVLTHISFTPKETDIYKIQQSGDLANLDGLDPAQLMHLPNLVQVRDALYSTEFRAFLEDVTGTGKLSGKKMDMAINIYTPGSYLLCHDDVIGTRRLSYILYLTDPDEPWKAEWGGGLRLYATEKKRNERGEEVKVPMPEHVKVIPPGWGQLSFFAVQPGESFHDVEEVYPPEKGSQQHGEQRTRMAISGWYHIPQEDEDGYEEGLEQKLVERSSLSQLQGKEADEFEEPRPQSLRFDQMRQRQIEQQVEQGKVMATDNDPTLLTELDLNILLQYITPHYLTPAMTEQLASSFEENSFLQLDRFLCDKFANPLNDFVLKHDKLNPDNDGNDENRCRDWRTARPPHKHRFAFHQPTQQDFCRPETDSSPKDLPLANLMTQLFPSTAFRKWLSIITGLNISGDACLDLLARRFRRGRDYALASAYEGQDPRLEFSLGCTASGGWENDQVDHKEGDVNVDHASLGIKGDTEIADGKPGADKGKTHTEVGGEEVYMAHDDEDDDDDHASENVLSTTDLTTAHPNRKATSDPAIYKDEEDDAILFADPPAWNRFSLVLRDRGTLRFVKYVSRAAEGDRWDIKGVIELGEGVWDEGDHAEGEDDPGDEAVTETDDEEEETDVDSEDEFEGFG